MHRAIWLAKECWDASVATDQNEQVTIAENWMWCFHRSDPPISVCIRDSLWSTLKDKTTYITKIMPRYPTSPCGGEIPFSFTRFLTSNVGHLLLRSTELLSSDVRELAEPAEDWCHNHVESNSDSTRKPRERGGGREPKPEIATSWAMFKTSWHPCGPRFRLLSFVLGFDLSALPLSAFRTEKNPLLSVF